MLAHYCHFSDGQILKLTLPKLRVYLSHVREQIQYEIKLHGFEVNDDERAKDKKATLNDIKNLFGWINAKS